ncbi:peptidyl-prolyl cis-trans isomerase, cyclophilin type [Skeletonema marinoi]|uniref:peptidylprolyl isomerase n=1 Tax=Skeletonema marinoi TaxID=267567 RepID=A0AAD8YPX9_9STRA|nr:peptidyl-prolyl cis-trans isomerase, cyclophilin type [Skeletonema marinoi]
MNTRRQFFIQQFLASASATLFPANTLAATDSSTYFSLQNNNNVPVSQRGGMQQKIQQQKLAEKRRKAASSFGKKWTPFVGANKWRTAEKCLLEMLPVKNGVFRRLQELIEGLEVFPESDADGWKDTLFDTLAILSLLDSKRSLLEPVFNQDDSTDIFISKSSIGERNIEALRSKIEELIKISSGGQDLGSNIGKETVNSNVSRQKNGRGRRANANLGNLDNIDIDVDIDKDAFIEGKRQALLALCELGELLVPSYPYAVPSRGKFGYLPRLLGRCTVTFSFERPSSSESTFGIKFGGGEKKVLGNVTIVADGYAAPITAGNFVDLSVRNFYTGLNVKAMRKRLGLIPSWSDNVIVNDLAEMKDNLDVLKSDVGSALERQDAVGMLRSKLPDDNPFSVDAYDESRTTMDVVLPILGSFQEGFYDPLTAKPRRIPLEVVAFDGSSQNKVALTYSSLYASIGDAAATGTTKYSEVLSSSSSQRSFSSATSSSSSNSTTTSYSNLKPVLSFDIPNIVALNHPDRAVDGGSSEFFAVSKRDISPKRTSLLDGQYAPFGYIVDGSDVFNSLRPGDVIGATYVSELGQLNLVKIRKNAFEGDEEDSSEQVTN